MNRGLPPMSELLEFAQTASTGTVHIARYGDQRYWQPWTRLLSPEAASIASLISQPCRMLCGTRLLVSAMTGHQAVWIAGDGFADDALCRPCVLALGDQQWRAFHADNRGSG